MSFSSGLLDSLQKNPEVRSPTRDLVIDAGLISQHEQSDSTRARNTEAKIQARVADELEKHLAEARRRVSETSEAISVESFDPYSLSPAPSWTEKPLVSRIADKLSGKSSEEQRKPDTDSQSLSKDIENLRKRLASTRRRVELDEGIKSAKEDVITCLNKNHDRPLDCWREVDVFKKEVARLEKDFIDSSVS